MLALIESTTTVSGSNVIVYRRPPQTGAEIGLLKDDGGSTITDQSSMTISAAGESVLVDQIQFQISSDRVELRESSALHFGQFISNTLSQPTMFLRIASDENEIDYERGFGGNAQWRRSSPDLGTFLQGFDSGIRMLIAVSSP